MIETSVEPKLENIKGTQGSSTYFEGNVHQAWRKNGNQTLTELVAAVLRGIGTTFGNGQRGLRLVLGIWVPYGQS